MSKDQLKRLLLEKQKREKIKKIDWNTPNFPKQNAFINDPSTLKLAMCTRRAGKSYSAGILLFKKAMENPGCNVLYVAKTRQSAKRIMYGDILLKINRQRNLGCTTNETELSFTLPNKSKIYLLGLDSAPNESEKILGQKFPLIVIDEAAFFQNNLENIIYEVMLPCISDYTGGQIVMISTSSDYINCYFYQAVVEGKGGWSTHQWITEDNPFMKEKFIKQKQSLMKANPEVEKEPRYRRMYLNEWIIDANNIIYKFDKNRDLVDYIPTDSKLEYILGVDLGYEDDSAFTVTGFDSKSGILYIIETFKKKHMILTDVAEKIKEFQGRYKINEVIIDGAAKQSVEEMRIRFNINFKAAEKVNKKDYIEILNNELICKRVKLVNATTQDLQEEYYSLIWSEQARLKNKWIEDPKCDNHLCDSALYAWRYSYTYLRDEEQLGFTEPTSEKAVDKFWEREADRLITRQNKLQESQDWLLTEVEEENEETFSSYL